MAEHDLFDLTNLPFDPAGTDVRKIQAAIDKAVKDLDGRLGGESQTAKRDALNRQIAFLKNIPNEIFEPDGKKVTQKYRDMAKVRTDTEISKLKAVVNLWVQSITGQKIVTEGRIKKHKQDGFMLDVKNIEKVYKDEGFTIKPSPKVAKPDFPAQADKIYNLLKTIRELADYRKFYPAPNYPDNSRVDTLYSFIAYLEKEPENAAQYRGEITENLAKLFDKYAIDYAKKQEDPRDPLGLVIKDLIALGKSNVFNNDTNRAKYEKYLLFKRPEMTELFDSLKAAKQTGAANLEDPKIAEPAIKKIGEVFGDRNEAISMYCFVAGISGIDEVDPVFYVKCTHCQNLSEFDSVESAKKENKCNHCKSALYKACPSCGELSLESVDRCSKSSCRFVFASAAMFEKYMIAAEQALREGRFDDARELLGKAKSANPAEIARTGELERRIDKDEDIVGRPINELRQLVNDRKFLAASQALSRTIAAFPKLNVSTFESQIKSTLSKVQATFESAKKQTPSECANSCFDILELCADFKPALDFLRTHQPLAVKNLTVAIDKINCRASLNWVRTGEKGVAYRIVRKFGNEAPKNELDCDTVLKDDFNETAFRDDSIPPGTWCSYGVFAKRMGVFSPVVGSSVLLLAEVTDIRHEINGTNVRITWNLPKNCTGVKVIRTYNGMETLLTDNAQASYEDKGLEYGAKYVYTIRANYLGHSPSSGVSLPVTPVPTISSDFTINAKQVKGSKYNVSWKIPQKGIELRILVNKRIFRETKSDSGSCEIELPANDHHVVEVAAYSAGNWINSVNSVEINTYPPLEVDKEATNITEKPVHGSAGNYKIDISIVLSGAMPGNVVGFYYAVRVKSGTASQVPWVSIDEIGNSPDIRRVSIEKYRNDDKIAYTTTTKDDEVFYLTIFTIYSVNGKDVVSDPCKRRIDRPVLANASWKVSKPLFGKAKLYVEIKPNRQIMRIPRLVLCASDKKLLYLADAREEEIIKDIEEVELAAPVSLYRQEYEIANGISKNIRLFLFSDSTNPNEKFVTQWMQGFQGKL